MQSIPAQKTSVSGAVFMRPLSVQYVESKIFGSKYKTGPNIERTISIPVWRLVDDVRSVIRDEIYSSAESITC